MITLNHHIFNKSFYHYNHNIFYKYYHLLKLHSHIRQLYTYNKYVHHQQYYYYRHYYHHISTDNTVAIAMSGGIDSSAVAMILKDKGYNCIGVYMKNWDLRDEYDNDNSNSNRDGSSSGSSSSSSRAKKSCEYYDDIRDMKQVCERLGIPAFEVFVYLYLYLITIDSY